MAVTCMIAVAFCMSKVSGRSHKTT